MLRVKVADPPRRQAHERHGNAGSVVVYGAGANQVPVLEACRRRGWRTIAIDRNPHAPGSAIADRFICVSLRDHAAIHQLLAGEQLVGVVARVTDQQALESSRRLAEERGLAAACPELVAASTSKRMLGRICADAGLPTPRRIADADAHSFASDSSGGLAGGPTGGPKGGQTGGQTGGIASGVAGGFVIVRPDVTVRGKQGIYRTSSEVSFEERWAEAAACSQNGAVDVSEWIDGVDVSVLARLDYGRGRRLAVWDEWVGLDSRGGVSGLGCGMPSCLGNELRAVDGVVDALARRFARSRCLITLSLRVDPAGRPFIIEIHLGVGGDSIAETLIPAALPGLDIFDSLVMTQIGEDWTPPATEPRPRALLPGGAGWRLVEAPDVETLRALARASIPADYEIPRSLRSCETALRPC